MSVSKREQTLLVITITLVVLGVNWLVLTPLLRNWGRLGRQVTLKRAELEKVHATIDRQPNWDAKLRALQASLGQKVEGFQQPSDVLKKIEEVGSGSGVLITTRKPLPAVEKDVYRELPVQCSFDATVESLVKFLYALQTGSGFMNVEQLQVSPRPDQSGILRCDIQIRALASKTAEGAS